MKKAIKPIAKITVTTVSAADIMVRQKMAESVNFDKSRFFLEDAPSRIGWLLLIFRNSENG